MILPDYFIDQDSPAAMYARAGLDAKGIVAKVFEAFNVQPAPGVQPVLVGGRASEPVLHGLKGGAR
jgi:hypothetical protein